MAPSTPAETAKKILQKRKFRVKDAATSETGASSSTEDQPAIITDKNNVDSAAAAPILRARHSRVLASPVKDAQREGGKATKAKQTRNGNRNFPTRHKSTDNAIQILNTIKGTQNDNDGVIDDNEIILDNEVQREGINLNDKDNEEQKDTEKEDDGNTAENDKPFTGFNVEGEEEDSAYEEDEDDEDESEESDDDIEPKKISKKNKIIGTTTSVPSSTTSMATDTCTALTRPSQEKSTTRYIHDIYVYS